MKTADQLLFVCNLTESIKSQFAEAHRQGEVPAEWDGLELRQWLADKFANETCPLGRKRLKDYRNTVAVSNKL